MGSGSDLGSDFEAAGGVGHTGRERDGFEQAGGDEAGGAAVEVDDRGCGLFAVDAVAGAQRDERVGESRTLPGGVDLCRDGREGVPSPVGVVVSDRL